MRWLVNLLFMAGMMGAQWAASSLHLSAKIDSTQASAASEVRPQTPSPDSSTVIINQVAEEGDTHG